MATLGLGKYLDQRPRTADRWREKYWDGLAQYLEQLVDSALCPQFADLLVGYLLVTENESPGPTQHPFVTDWDHEKNFASSVS